MILSSDMGVNVYTFPSQVVKTYLVLSGEERVKWYVQQF
jgi:hypothetical protein